MADETLKMIRFVKITKKNLKSVVRGLGWESKEAFLKDFDQSIPTVYGIYAEDEGGDSDPYVEELPAGKAYRMERIDCLSIESRTWVDKNGAPWGASAAGVLRGITALTDGEEYAYFDIVSYERVFC